MITDKVKGDRQEKGGGDRRRVMSVEKRHALINIKAILIKTVVLTETGEWGRGGDGERGEHRKKTTLTISIDLPNKD